MVGALILVGLAAAGIHPVVPGFGHRDDLVMVKFAGAAATVRDPRLLAGAARLLGPASVAPRAGGRLPGWWQIRTDDGPRVAAALAARPDVLHAYLAWEPAPPPTEGSETPDFTGEQAWLAAVDGLGFPEAALWPGGRGEEVVIGDVEYGWDPLHEDLITTAGAGTWGWDSGAYPFHGNSVLGQLVGADNGFGIVGAVPDAGLLVLSPYADAATYDVAAAIVAAAELLEPGDVLLIEQQAYVLDSYGPVEIDPGVWDAISLAVDAGITVVEPAGNGALDLDDPALEGWFDPQHDSGAIIVGGGASPLSGYLARSWYPYGSCYGARVDVQAWYDHVVTATSGDYGGFYADLYFPDGDATRAYTQTFGGTSGASPMITAVAAIVQSVRLAAGEEPWDPRDLRAVIRGSGSGQTGDQTRRVGPLPDLRRLLRTWR